MTKFNPRLMAGALMVSVLAASGLIWLAAFEPETGNQLTSRLHRHWPLLQGTGPESAIGEVTVRADPAATGRPISPFVYGVAAANAAEMRALGASLGRSGGNPSSRYNWVNGHAWNAGRDWQFRDVNYSNQDGSSADHAVQETKALGASILLTVPTLGWVARDDNNETQSVNVPSQGGPAVRPGSSAIQGYDPATNRAATSVPSYARQPGGLLDQPGSSAPAVYQDEWIHHLVTRFGNADRGGVQYYAMDNEPDLWSTTHTDVHPTRMSYEDMLTNFEEYAIAVKAQDPKARVLGPDLSGWISYFYSDLDRGSDNFATHSDRAKHGDEAFLPWWLGRLARADADRGQRTLDLLDVHYYPQADGVYSQAADSATRALRIRSVRSLYDPSYRDESWISDQVALIPRLKKWINDKYPGTGLAITEYNWGGEHDASGAVALADVLGTFGREGVDVASYWTFPPPDSPAGAAFRLYRNYDGRGGVFGSVSVPSSASDSRVAAYAASHPDTGEVDVILANQSTSKPARVSVDIGGKRSYLATRFGVSPGSSRIQPASMASPASAFELAPLGLSLVRLMPT